MGRSIGDALKNAVQARGGSLSSRMPAAKFGALFEGCEKIKVTHKEESSRHGVSIKSFTKYSMTGHEAGEFFGVTKVRGGSFNGFYGATTWCITSLIAVHEDDKMKL